MKQIFLRPLFTVLMACTVCACSDSLDIRHDYEFTVVHLPYQKHVGNGETVEIRLQIVREGYYDEARYYMRYFQSSGQGELRLDDGTLFLPNDLYELKNDTFRLYYTPLSSDAQTVDVYFSDNQGKTFELSFDFAGERGKENEE